ncbi:hypothetical protein QNO07_09985 [Streptomyces sp. 549]|uniref:hypothetical protein n=1 Tax=Streptomyces sp. 549 TaxID=3049076 RepID=UPI0024C2E696|nr:hypothetical protein [Streptomyces sp. 549]MDK1473746.1 hypothetical protein [Streptomyces sp. 549]
MELTEHIAGVRAGTTEPAVLLGEFRRTPVFAPVIDGGFMSASMGGIRWVYAFTDSAAYARFTTARGDEPGAEPEYREILGARLLDVVVPALEGPAGVALNVADENGSMMFPPVQGIVPDAAAVDLPDVAAVQTSGGSASADNSGHTTGDNASGTVR